MLFLLINNHRLNNVNVGCCTRPWWGRWWMLKLVLPVRLRQVDVLPRSESYLEDFLVDVRVVALSSWLHPTPSDTSPHVLLLIFEDWWLMINLHSSVTSHLSPVFCCYHNIESNLLVIISTQSPQSQLTRSWTNKRGISSGYMKRTWVLLNIDSLYKHAGLL